MWKSLERKEYLNLCKYCEINPKTNLGRDYYRDDYVDPDEINKVNGEDGIMFTYIDCKNHPALIISHPDPECYSQETDKIFIGNCPWCGRNLKKEHQNEQS